MADKIPTIEQSANRMIGLMHQAGKDEQVQMAQMGIVRSRLPISLLMSILSSSIRKMFISPDTSCPVIPGTW